MAVEFVLDGDCGRAVVRFRKLQMAALDFTPLWIDLGESFKELAAERFASQQFAPLSPKYQVRKLDAGFTGGVMVREGVALRSLTSDLDVFRPARHSLVLGSTKRLLAINARGAYNRTTGRRLPARRPVPVGIWKRRARARIRRRLVNAAKATAAQE